MRFDDGNLRWCEVSEFGFNELEVGRLVRHQERNWLILVIAPLQETYISDDYHNYHDDYYYNLGNIITLQCQITGELTTRNSVELL